jgi:hypothetical protein
MPVATIVGSIDVPFEDEPPYAPEFPSGWYFRVLGELRRLAEMPKGWDSHGADPPELPMIWAASEIAHALAQFDWTEPSVVTATRSGGIQFEWGFHVDAYFELECVSRDTAHYFFSDSRLGIEDEGVVRAGDSLDQVISYISRTRRNSSL